MKKTILYSIAIICLVFLLLTLFVKWVLWEPESMERGSLVYMLKVPDELKAFPTWGELTAPKFDISLPDSSLGPVVARMKYTTSFTMNEVLQEAKKLQFKCEQYPPEGALCEKVVKDTQLIQLSYGKILYNRDENITVTFIEKE